MEADFGSEDDQEKVSKIELLRESIFSMPLDGLEANYNLNLLSKNFTVNMALLREVRASAYSKLREEVDALKVKVTKTERAAEV